MAITAAAIEANGWVLRVTLGGVLSSVSPTDTIGANFAGYALAATGANPALTLAGTTSGYVQSGGQAVASTSVPRRFVGTKVVRRVVNATAAGVRDAKTPDETDNGDGTITVRIALSQHVYAGDANLTLTALAGWRTGAGAQSIAVTNGSTVAAPAPIVRWSDVPYQLQSGSFGLECVVAGHHPSGLAPVAGVRFTVTDGTTVKSFWTTALSSSPRFAGGGTGAPLRVYAVTVDPTTATALTQGLLRCDFEAYPWIGPVQKSDTAGTKSMTGLGTAALSTAALVPFVVAYNPGNAWIVPRYVDVDEVNGTATAANVTVGTTPAAASAGTPANSISTAVQALENLNVTVAAANGQAAITRSIDGAHIRIRSANGANGCTGVVNGTGSVGPGTGVQSLASWVTIEGDPADTSARACILRSPAAAAANARLTRTRVANLSVEAQTNSCLSSLYAWLDNVEVRAVAGQSATTGTPVGASGGLQFLTNGKWWRHGSGPGVSGSTQNPVLVRAMTAERTFNAPLVASCARLPSAIAGTIGAGGIAATTTDPGAVERIYVGNDLRYLSGQNAFTFAQMANSAAPAGLTLGQPWPVVSRQAAINNIGETYGGAGYPLWNSIGENNPVVSTEIVIEGNTLTGDRTNNPYGDLNMATVALNDSADNLVRVYRFANNVTMKNASKHDFFNDPTVLAQRQGAALTATRSKAYAVGAEIVIAGSPANIYHCTTAGTTASTGGPTGTGTAIGDGSVVWQWIATEGRHHGYRAQAIGAWPSHYGVGYEGNIDFQGPAGPSYDPEFFFEFYGLGSDQLSAEGIDVGSTPFTLDKSGSPNRLAFQPLPDGTGGGDYRPLTSGSGAYVLGRAKTANVDTDVHGVARAATFAAGALEAGSVAVAPAGARQPSLAAATQAGWTATLYAAAARSATRAAIATAGWTASLAPAPARSPSLAAGSLAGWAATLLPTAARSASAATSSATAWFGSLMADAGRSPSSAEPSAVTWSAALLPDPARSPMLASASAIGVDAATAAVPDNGTIGIVDETLPTLLPGSATSDRTLIVGGEFRTLIVNNTPY